MAADNMSQLMGALGAWLEANPASATAADRDQATELIFSGALLGVQTRDVNSPTLLDLAPTDRKLLDTVRAWAYPDETFAAPSNEPVDAVDGDDLDHAAPVEQDETDDVVETEPVEAPPLVQDETDDVVETEPDEAPPVDQGEPDDAVDGDEPEDASASEPDSTPLDQDETLDEGQLDEPAPPSVMASAPVRPKKPKRLPRKQKKKLSPAARKQLAAISPQSPSEAAANDADRPDGAPTTTFATLALRDADVVTVDEDLVSEVADHEVVEAVAEISFDEDAGVDDEHVAPLEAATESPAGDEPAGPDTHVPSPGASIPTQVRVDETSEVAETSRTTSRPAWFSEELLWWAICVVAVVILFVRRFV